MNHAFFVLRFLLVLSLFGDRLDAAEKSSQPTIARAKQMPNLPHPFAVRDWLQVTRDYLDLVLSFDRQGNHLPLVNWLTDNHEMISFPSYVGGPRDPEAINYFAALVSGTLVGLDMRDYRGQNWVRLGKNFFDADQGVYVNRLNSKTGQSFWYDIFPNVLAYQLQALYPDEDLGVEQAHSVARRWQEACVTLGGKTDPVSIPNFDHTGLDLLAMRPVEKGWIEPEAAAGIAWLEYMAWIQFRDPDFLIAADWAVRSLEQRPLEKSPLYEVLLPYGALIAARMNAETGSHYDVDRLVNDCFEPRGRPQARPGWGVIADRWQGQDVHGLVGSTTDGDGYAFAMNTFQWAGALVPLVRYDTRYAHDIGKWMLNLANASRLFYPEAHDPAHQSSSAWSQEHDPKSVIAYEGIRKWKRGSETARADYRTQSGRTIAGSFASTHFRMEAPPALQVFEEVRGETTTFEHVWEFDLPKELERWLVVSAERIDGGHEGNEFQFSFSNKPEGPFTFAFSVASQEPAQVIAIPGSLQHKLYVKVVSSNPETNLDCRDQLIVDAMAITYRTKIGPYAQGDTVVTFVDLLNEATVPIVLYRPASVTTDLGLYGSSHVGILGGIIRRTNVPAILQLDLLKTDYFHGEAYPTFLYYNPCPTSKSVRIDVGPAATDLYDAATDRFMQCNVSGRTEFTIPSDTARIVVLSPAGGKVHREGKRTLIDNIVVNYMN